MYSFYIPYLDLTVELTEEEFAVWHGYARGLIGVSKFEKEAMRVAREKGIPRGVRRSAIYFMLDAVERGTYIITEEELKIPEEEREEEVLEEVEELEEEEISEWTEICEVEFEFHCRLAYCKSDGHHIDVEVEVRGEIDIECDYLQERRNELIDRLAQLLRRSFEEFLEQQYVLVYDEKETECGISSFEVVDKFPVRVYNVSQYAGRHELHYVIFRRANVCGGTYHRLEYLEKTLEHYMEEGLWEYGTEVAARTI